MPTQVTLKSLRQEGNAKRERERELTKLGSSLQNYPSEMKEKSTQFQVKKKVNMDSCPI